MPLSTHQSLLSEAIISSCSFLCTVDAQHTDDLCVFSHDPQVFAPPDSVHSYTEANLVKSDSFVLFLALTLRFLLHVWGGVAFPGHLC